MRIAVMALAALIASYATAADLPNPSLTPGAVLTTDRETICRKGYAGTVRHVTPAAAREAFRRYGKRGNDRSKCAEGYEVDHLISLELGGSNDIANLWPQNYCGTWNAHKKDQLENRLHRLVCDGEITPENAQKTISENWIEAYRKYMGERPD